MALSGVAVFSVSHTVFSSGVQSIPMTNFPLVSEAQGEYQAIFPQFGPLDSKSLNDGSDYIQKANFTNNSLNSHSENQLTLSPEYMPANDDKVYYENPFKFSSSVLDSFNKYKFVYKKALPAILAEYKNKQNSNADQTVSDYTFTNIGIVESLFNPWLAVNVMGMMVNQPIMDIQDKESKISIEKLQEGNNNASVGLDESGGGNITMTQDGQLNLLANSDEVDTSDCSIRKLVELSQVKEGQKYPKLGRETYRYSDFMYCKDLGKVSNNLLITLRKFPTPVGDNITTIGGFEQVPATEKDRNNNAVIPEIKDPYALKVMPDVGRLVAWIGEDNKLEDILSFEYDEKWEEMSSEIDQKESQAENTGPVGDLANLANPKYMNAFKIGLTGGGNSLLSRMTMDVNTHTSSLANGTSGFEIMGNNNSTTDDRHTILSGANYDRHKIYEPPGTIRKTHVYNGEMTFSHEFTLVFNYELRAYDNINPKSAFLDLLGNILAVTYRKGNFWGGSNQIIGTPDNSGSKLWNITDQLVDNTSKAGQDFFAMLFGTGSADTFVNQLKKTVSDTANSVEESTGVDLTNPESLANAAGKLLGGEFMGNLIGGMMKNSLGRPAMYAFNSLLTSAPVGLWHVTIGNPRNPILSIGNLILGKVKVQMYGPLGIDDFPTGIKVTVPLKHAMSRDASDIANMFTQGQSPIVYNLVGKKSGAGTKEFFNQDYINKHFGEGYDLSKLTTAIVNVNGG
jgi:hypothetical protein